MYTFKTVINVQSDLFFWDGSGGGDGELFFFPKYKGGGGLKVVKRRIETE